MKLQLSDGTNLTLDDSLTDDEAMQLWYSAEDQLKSESSVNEVNQEQPAPQDPTGELTQFNAPVEQPSQATIAQMQAEANPKDTSDFSRGFKTSYEQLPELGYGLEAGAYAIGESAFGEGGMLTQGKQEAVAKMIEAQKETQANAKQSDSFTYAYEKAKEGDFNALADTVQYGLGYGLGQMSQAVITGGLGSTVAKTAAETFAKEYTAKLVEQEALKVAEQTAARELTQEQIQQQAVKNVAESIANKGRDYALGAQAVGMEGGEILGDLAKQSTEQNRSLTAWEVTRGLGATALAAAGEFYADRFGLDILGGKRLSEAGKYTEGLKGNLLRGAATGVKGGGVEGGTEFAQTLIEEAGKGKDPFSSESLRQAIDATALGFIGGGAIGTVGGALSPAQQKPDQPATGEIDPSMLSGGLDGATTQTTAQQPAQTSSDWQRTMGDIRNIVGENQLVDNETIAKDIAGSENIDDAIQVFNHVGEAISTDHAITQEVATQEQLNIASQRGNDQITGITEPIVEEPVKAKSDKLDATQESLDFIGQAVAQGGAELKGSMLYLPTGEKYSLNKAQRDHYTNLITPIEQAPEMPVAEMPVTQYYNEPNGKYYGDIKEVTKIMPSELKPLSQTELNGAISSQKESGKSEEEWAKSVDLSEPIKATIYSDGEIKIQNGHHRYLAAKILNKPLNVELKSINAKNQILNDAINRIKLDVSKSETPTADYETRNADRVARIKEATTPEEAQSIYAEETSDNERHFEGTRKAEIAIKDTLVKLQRESANKKEDEAYAAGEWVFHFPTNSLSDANQMAKSMEKIEPKNEYKVVPWQNDGYLVQKRNIEAASKLPKEKTGTVENPILRKNGKAFTSQQGAQTHIRTNPELSKETHTWVKLGDEKYGIVTKDQVVSKATNPAANLNKVQGNEELRVLIQKLGGLSRVEMKERGFTDYKGNTRLFNNGVRSRTFDDMATVLRSDYGFGEIQGANDLETALWGSLNGKPYYGYEGIDKATEQMFADKADQDEQKQDELLNTYTSEEVNAILDAKTQAEKDQLMKDFKAEKKRKADQEVDTVVDEMLGKGKTTTMDIFAPERKGKVAVGREVTVEGEQLANSGTKVKELYPNHWFYGNKGAQDKFNDTEIDYEGEYPNLESISLINTDSNIGGFYDQVEQAIYQTTQSDRTTLHELGHAVHHQLLNYRKLSEDERATLKELILGDDQANHPYLASDKELVAEFNLYAHLFPVKAKAYLPELYKELVEGRKEVVIKLGSQESKGLTQALKQANVTIEKGYGEEEEPITNKYKPKEYTEEERASRKKYRLTNFERARSKIDALQEKLGFTLLDESDDYLLYSKFEGSSPYLIQYSLVIKNLSPPIGRMFVFEGSGKVLASKLSYYNTAREIYGKDKATDMMDRVDDKQVLEALDDKIGRGLFFPENYNVYDFLYKITMGGLNSIDPLETEEGRIKQIEKMLKGKIVPKSNIKFSKAKAQERLAPNGKPSNLNATQYEQVRTPEFKAWFGDWENDPENASKVVDENGEPLVVYHGSPQSGFSEFYTGNTAVFFTDLESVAASYAGEIDDAEIYDDYDKNDNSGQGIYPVFLNIQNPKTGDWEGAQWGKGVDGLSTDRFANRAKNDSYDGVILENVADGGWLAPVYLNEDETSTIYAVFNPNQIKSATGNTGEFSKESNDIRFSKAVKKVLDDNPLAIVHNLSVKNLTHADKMGGLPAPSIAVVNQKYPLSGFGEITLIGDTSQFAPEADKANRFYNADVYSPRYPSVTYIVDSKAVSNANEALSDDAKALVKAIGYRGTINASSIEDRGLVQGLADNVTLKYEFLKSIGKAPKLQYKVNKLPPANMKKFVTSNTPSMELSKDPAFVQTVVDNYNESIRKRNETLNQNRPYLEVESQQASNLAFDYQYAIEEFRNQKGKPKSIDDYATSKLIREKTNQAQYEKWLVENYSNLISGERIFNGYTNAGNRIYLPHNLDTVVKLMTKTVKGGENVSYGIGTIRAYTAKQFKTVKAIQAARGDIVSAEKLEALKEELSNEFENLSEELRPYSDYSNPSATDALSDLVSKGTRAFKESYQDVPAETMTKVYDFLDKLKNMPAHYFEAKIGRAVKLNEFAGALVPKGKEYDEAVKILNANGITKIKRYTENDSQSRSDALLNFSELLFSQTQEPTADNHTEQSLKEGLTQAGDDAYGKGWTDRLLATGMFEIISDADAQAIIEESSGAKFALVGDRSAANTQIDTTMGAYAAVARNLFAKIPNLKNILDYGAGKGRGTASVSRALKNKSIDANVKSYEPFPENWAKSLTEEPDYTNADNIKDGSQDAVVNLNVLNVVPKAIRDDIVKNIGRVLKDGGIGVISSRRWKGDVDTIKPANSRAGEEPNSFYVTRKLKGEIQTNYQKGIEPDELVAYVQELLPNFDVRKINGYGASAVIIQKPNGTPLLDSILKSEKTQSKGTGSESTLELRKEAKDLGAGERYSAFGVGKKMGDEVYLHRDYEDVLPQGDLADAKEKIGDFEYNLIRYNAKTGAIGFFNSPDFDTSPEPVNGELMVVEPDGTIRNVPLNKDLDKQAIYHHKWQWVKDDYTGFDVAQSIERSIEWQKVVNREGINRKRIGFQGVWQNEVLKPFDIKYSINGEIEAFFNPADGKTYFVAENIDKATDLHYLMMHEVGVHALNMGGNKEEFESILKQVDNLVKVKNPAAMQGRQDALDADTPQEDLREETLAYLLKYAPKLKVVERFKAWLKNALRNMAKMFPASQKLGFIQWANKLSDQDLLYIANATLRKAPEMLGATGQNVKFSKSKKAKEGEIVNRSTGYTAYDKAKPIPEEVDNKAKYPEGVSLEEERDWLMQQLRRFDSFRKLNDKSNELINKYLTTMGRLPELGNYLGLRYQTLGKIDNVDDIVRNVFDTLQKATKEDSKEIYTYLTDNKATTEFIIDPQMALMAKDLKEAITIIGKKLVEFNIIPIESFQMYEGRYLPRVYLEHIIQSSDRYQSLGSGKTLSPMGYAKRRDNNLPEEFRRLIKGEIKNTAYLASRTLSIPLRDIAMMEFFNQISDNEKWVWKQSLITVEIDAKTNRPTAIFDDDGVINYNATNSALEGKPKKVVVRKVTPYFLDKEADRILDQSYSAPEEDRKDMQDLANMMKRAASQAMVNMDAVPADFMKMPNIAKYGSLRGLVVHKLIYDDLVGTINTYGAAGEQTALENFFGNNGVLAKVTSAFKFSHVAINIPTQVTNLLSNGLLLHMSGVRFDKVPVRVMQAFKEVLNEGENYKKMIAMGGRKATFSNQELSGITEWLLENEAEFSDKDMDWFSVVHIMRELSYLAGKTVRGANNLHQNIEMVFKVAKFIDMKAKGANDETAAVMAHQALFDYSFIPRWAKWLRTVPMGIPFITWTIKSFEATLRTAANRPTTFLPYYMLGYAMSLAAGADFGDDGEDKLKAILKLLPERMQRGGSIWILPIRDDAGRTQLIDMKNLFPWGKTAEAIDSLSKLVGNQDVEELRTLADSVGVFSSPITQAVVAINTNKDAFTGKQIVDENDPPAAKLQSILEYTYGMMSPPMLGGKGDIATLVKSQFPSEYEGIMNKDGSPKKTEQQAFIHLFTGLSIKSVDSDFDRRKKIDAFNNMITGIKAQRTRELRSNPNLSEESRRIVREKYDARIERVKEKKQKFKDETDVLK